MSLPSCPSQQDETLIPVCSSVTSVRDAHQLPWLYFSLDPGGSRYSPAASSRDQLSTEWTFLQRTEVPFGGAKHPFPSICLRAELLLSSTPKAWTPERHAHKGTPHYTSTNPAEIKQDRPHAAALLQLVHLSQFLSVMVPALLCLQITEVLAGRSPMGSRPCRSMFSSISSVDLWLFCKAPE